MVDFLLEVFVIKPQRYRSEAMRMLIENARLSKLKTTFFIGGCCFLRMWLGGICVDAHLHNLLRGQCVLMFAKVVFIL